MLKMSELRGDLRYHRGKQNDNHQNGDRCEQGRVNQRLCEFAAHLLTCFIIFGQPFKNGAQLADRLSRFYHGAKDRIKQTRVGLHSHREGLSLQNGEVQRSDDVGQFFIFFLLLDNGERFIQRQRRGDQRRQLTRKKR